MSDPRVRWRVDLDRGVWELMCDGVKIDEQSFVEMVETLTQGASALRWQAMMKKRPLFE